MITSPVRRFDGRGKVFALALFISTLASSFAAAQSETIVAPFNNSSGTTTANSYVGYVHITVSGTGTADGTQVSDAFYYVATQTETSPADGSYELAIGTPEHPFIGRNDGQHGRTDAIKYDIVGIDGVGSVPSGTIPAYSNTNTYGFTIYVPNPTATPLTFGVNDDVFSDDTGSYTITVTQLNEPANSYYETDGEGTISGPHGGNAKFEMIDIEAEKATNKYYEGAVAYQDKTSGISFGTGKITTVTAWVNGSTFSGSATIGSGKHKQVVNFSITVTGNRNPSTDDTFSIALSNGYHASGNLTSGSISVVQDY